MPALTVPPPPPLGVTWIVAWMALPIKPPEAGLKLIVVVVGEAATVSDWGPLVLLFNTIGLNPIVALAGMSIIWPLGDALPPTAIIGRLTVDVVGYKDSYAKFLKACLVPAIIIIVIGTLIVIESKYLGFLTGI